jgi:hypothetical protein
MLPPPLALVLQQGAQQQQAEQQHTSAKLRWCLQRCQQHTRQQQHQA